MFWQIFVFELKYRVKRPATWVYFSIFFLFGIFAVSTGSTPASEKVMHNAPWTMADGNVVFSLFAMLVCSAIMGVPLYRDIEHQTRYYFYSYPITKGGYFWGRFMGSFVFVLLIGTAYSWGCIIGSGIGPAFGWVPRERIGHYGLWNYFQPYFLFSVTNLLLASAIFFALVALTRNVKVIYTASIFLFIGYLLATFLTRDLENRELVKLLDPFAINTFQLETRFFTPVEKNTLLTPLTKDIIANRLIWTVTALLIIAFAYWRFNFQKFLRPEQVIKRSKRKEMAISGPLPIKNVERKFGNWHFGKIGWNLSKIEFLSIFRDNYFKAILGGGIVFLILDFWIGNTLYSVGDKPLTVFLMDYKSYDYSIFIFIILLFYTGEAVHREKATRFDIINDAMPVPSAVFLPVQIIRAGVGCIGSLYHSHCCRSDHTNIERIHRLRMECLFQRDVPAYLSFLC